MPTCKHTRWLRLARKDEGFTLEVSDRSQRLLDSLSKPEKQTPSLLVLVGNDSKLRLLQKLGVNATGPRGKRGHGEIHLFISPSSSRTNSPLLIADGDIPPQNRLGRPWKPQLCHEVASRPMASSFRGNVADIASLIYHQLLLPFADIVCFFATDLGGIEKVVHHVALWMDKGKPYMSQLHPWLVVVVDDVNEENALVTFRSLMRQETGIDLKDQFAEVRVLSLSQPKRRRGAARSSPWVNLTIELSKISSLARQARLDAGYLFTAYHLADLLQRVTGEPIGALREPLNFIQISRLMNPLAPDLESHLASFLDHFQSVDSLRSFALPMMASSFILDHYPPGMHRKITVGL